MICRYFEDGEKLNVADLNKITVLIDRSETEFTEVALNEWPVSLDGPPHSHELKEQIFFMLSGVGSIDIGEQTYTVNGGELLYIPAGELHRTKSSAGEPLRYILFNAFSNSDKEGHASFADHIARVKDTRKQQALSQTYSYNSESEKESMQKKPHRTGKFISDISIKQQPSQLPSSEACFSVPLLSIHETERSETHIVHCPPHKSLPLSNFNDREQTWYILSGEATVTIGRETQSV
ncbi:MAG: cupin domain-containing protein, partial [Spirochaetaceae bacterium]|nr:cupin domain-containing protein [Spirochaetaceae bacterium]MCF7939164.1 cupin domain-containing protein [Spirochaetales bacterium]